jgi:hypothetical protein
MALYCMKFVKTQDDAGSRAPRACDPSGDVFELVSRLKQASGSSPVIDAIPTVAG